MEYIKTYEQYNSIQIKLKGDDTSKTINIHKGDVLKGGKFKNKKTIVKSIGYNNKGDITINNKPFSKFRQCGDSDSIVEADHYEEWDD